MMDVQEILGLVGGVVITLMIFSYLLGDNFLYRWALAILVGSGAGYAMGMAWQFILREWLKSALQGTPGTRLAYFVPLLLGILLLLKGFNMTRLFQRVAVLGNISIAYLIGVGAGVAVSGAVLGTLVPQMWATGGALKSQGIVMGGIILIGTITSLIVFSTHKRHTDKHWSGVERWARIVGRYFVAIALAVAFAGALTTALTLWIARWWQIAKLALGS